MKMINDPLAQKAHGINFFCKQHVKKTGSGIFWKLAGGSKIQFSTTAFFGLCSYSEILKDSLDLQQAMDFPDFHDTSLCHWNLYAFFLEQMETKKMNFMSTVRQLVYKYF